MFSELITNPVFLAILTIISFVTGSYQLFFKKPKYLLNYNLQEVELVGSQTAAFGDALTVLYQGSEVPRVTSSEVVVWNGGSEHLDRTSISQGNPLHFEVPADCVILDCTVEKVMRDDSTFSVLVTENRRLAQLEFGYMNANEGARISVIHTGTKGQLEFAGAIKGSPKSPKRKNIVLSSKMSGKRVPVYLKASAPLLLIVVAGSIGMVLETLRYLGYDVQPDFLKLPDVRLFVNFLFLGTTVIGSLAVLWAARRPYPSALD
ncbi:hypothetical protein [Rhizobium sp. 2MFCol3.1]|uniref:hypothetical protein n=1 Tax=Rhizobium sp. 2MFCol3.1 TaxID=1246459 RepID=UPI00035C9993|nr:hypothetical protein [Rhizobium sp. 2MFCol3.1]